MIFCRGPEPTSEVRRNLLNRFISVRLCVCVSVCLCFWYLFGDNRLGQIPYVFFLLFEKYVYIISSWFWSVYLLLCMCICLYVLFIICRLATTELLLKCISAAFIQFTCLCLVRPRATVSFLTAIKTLQTGSENPEKQVYIRNEI